MIEAYSGLLLLQSSSAATTTDLASNANAEVTVVATLEAHPVLSVSIATPAETDAGTAISVTFTITDPAPGDTTVTPSNSIAGTWAGPIVLNGGTPSLSVNFTPAQMGTYQIGATGDNGAAAAAPVELKVWAKVIASGPAVAASAATLSAAGWPRGSDGFYTFIEKGSNYYVFGAEGSSTSGGARSIRIDGTLANPVSGGSGTRIEVALTGPKEVYDYAAVETVVKLPDTSTLIGVTHYEYWLPASKFWTKLGLAWSTDNGATWRDMGACLAPTITKAETQALNTNVDMLGGTCVIVGSYLYIYYHDVRSDNSQQWICVARALIADIIAGISTNTSPVFQKYYNGAWTEPGLGGMSSPLDPSNEVFFWGTAFYHSGIGAYVMAGMWNTNPSWIAIKQSFDGLVWSRTKQIIHSDPQTTGSMVHNIYASLASAGQNGDRTLNDPVYCYWNRFPNGLPGVGPDPDLYYRTLTFDSGDNTLGTSASASATTTSTLATAIELSTDATCEASVSAPLEAGTGFSSTAYGSVEGVADLSTSIALGVSAVVGTVGVSATLFTGIPLSSTAEASASASAPLSTGSGDLESTASVSVEVSSSLTTAVSFSAQAEAAAEADAWVETAIILSAAANSTASVYASMSDYSRLVSLRPDHLVSAKNRIRVLTLEDTL